MRYSHYIVYCRQRMLATWMQHNIHVQIRIANYRNPSIDTPRIVHTKAHEEHTFNCAHVCRRASGYKRTYTQLHTSINYLGMGNRLRGQAPSRTVDIEFKSTWSQLKMYVSDRKGPNTAWWKTRPNSQKSAAANCRPSFAKNVSYSHYTVYCILPPAHASNLNAA